MNTPAYKEIPEFHHRLIDYTGTGFFLGAGGGSVSHFIRGLRSSPSGGRLVGGVGAIRTNGPLVAGRWGAIWAVYCAFETASFRARGRDDQLNSVAAGAATGGLFGMRRGAPAAALSALLGATLVAGYAGAYWVTDRTRPMFYSQTRMNRDSPAPGTATSTPMAALDASWSSRC